MTLRSTARLLASLLVLALGAAACGSSQPSSVADRAFLNDMVPHHRMAVAMAEMAAARGEHPQIKELAKDIAASQSAELAEMDRLRSRVEAGDSKSTFGMPGKAMGMDMDMDMGVLMRARPFDRAFIEDMVPHHEGAISMAQMELAKGRNPQARALAKRIIAAQSRETREMKRWGAQWFGAARPAA